MPRAARNRMKTGVIVTNWHHPDGPTPVIAASRICETLTVIDNDKNEFLFDFDKEEITTIKASVLVTVRLDTLALRDVGILADFGIAISS